MRWFGDDLRGRTALRRRSPRSDVRVFRKKNRNRISASLPAHNFLFYESYSYYRVASSDVRARTIIMCIIYMLYSSTAPGRTLLVCILARVVFILYAYWWGSSIDESILDFSNARPRPHPRPQVTVAQKAFTVQLYPQRIPPDSTIEAGHRRDSHNHKSTSRPETVARHFLLRGCIRKSIVGKERAFYVFGLHRQRRGRPAAG